MMTIKGERFLTIHALAGEVYKLSYTVPPKLSVSNNTGGNILIGAAPEFAENTAAGQYMTVAAYSAANNISMPFYEVYIKAESSGDIVIVRCG